jgi:uncharacterized membrane protein
MVSLSESGTYFLLLLFFHAVNTFALKGPFNKKENAFIIVMASSAANVAMATEVIAARALFYDILPKGLAPMFLLSTTQLLGYGIAGLMRREFFFGHI